MERQANRQRIIRSVILTSFLFFIAFININGQFQKKTLMAGGEINIPLFFENEDGSKYYYFNPQFGYFFLKNFAAGINTETSLYTLQGSRRTDLGIGPFVRYYLGVDPIYGFLHCSYQGTIIMYNTTSTNVYQSEFQPGIGLGYRLLPTVGIDVIFKLVFYHTNDQYTETERYTSSSLNTSLQIYFPPTSN